MALIMVTATTATDPTTNKLGGTALTILHISDLHFGPSHQFGQVMTAGQPVKDGDSLLVSLLGDIKEVLSGYEPHGGKVLICVTGDITDRAEIQQFKAAGEFLNGLRDGLKAFDPRLVVIPGNHDVLWDECESADRLVHWTNFAEHQLKESAVGTPSNQYALMHDFGSTHGAVVLALNTVNFVKKDDPDVNRGRLSQDGLKQMKSELDRVHLPPDAVKVAVLHHHPILIPDLVEAGRDYDAVVDGGAILKALRERGFHLVLHGHKHLPFQFSEDSRAAYGTSNSREQRPILVVCGGSVGSNELPTAMATPSNFYNAIRVKWLATSDECRLLVSPRRLVRFRNHMQLQPYEWYWREGSDDDRTYHSPPHTSTGLNGTRSEVGFTESGTSDEPRRSEYQRTRGIFPVVRIRPSLLSGQAHEATVWCEHHISRDRSVAPDPPTSVEWSAGPSHNVIRVCDDPTHRYEAEFSYFGPMLVRAHISFSDGEEIDQYIYVRLEASL